MATHSHDGGAPHTHSHEFNAAEHGHSHEILDGPGSFLGRELPIVEGRDWTDRAFTIGIGGYAYYPRAIPTLSNRLSHRVFSLVDWKILMRVELPFVANN